MSIRLNKATKECNVGLQTAVEFLQKKGFKDIEANPNTKITDEQYEMLLNEFNRDKGLRKQAAELSKQQRHHKEQRDQKRSETHIELTTVQKPKFLGKIDLDAPRPAVPAKEPAKEPAPAETIQPAKEAEARTEKPAVQEEKKTEEVKKPAAAPQEVKAPEVKATETHDTGVEKVTAGKAEESQKEAPAAAEGHKEEKKDAKPARKAPAAEKKKAPLGDEVDGVFRLKRDETPSVQFNVVGKVDLSALNQSTRPKKKSKEEKRREREDKNRAQNGGQGGNGERKKRVRIGKERVDVNAVGQQVQQQNNKKNNNNNQQGGGKKNKQKNQPRQQLSQPEVSDEEVAKQVRETLARLTSKGSKMGKGAKYRREKRDAIRQGMEEQLENEAAESKVLKLTEFVTANELATMMNIPVTQVIGTCMQIGIMVSINQRLDAETINIVAEEFGFTTEYVSAEVSEAVTEVEDDESDLVPRAPIVTVMGHVDHGKTSLLDYIRQTNVIAGEAGGITQHIGAYNVKLQDGRHVTFLDTPGHEAFTAMRARGAQVTDIAIIIVAADDDIMPQTKEAIAHASAANVPIVFAINKIDKPTANPEKIKEGLAQMNYLVEDWGGKYQSQDISAKKGIGVEELLEKVLLEAEMLDLKANPNRKASGTIIESSLDKGRGYVATVIVGNGTLRVGDIMLAGTT